MSRSSLHHLFRQALISFVLVRSAVTQSIVTDYTPYQALPTTPLPAINNSGTFTWPLTGSVELYEVGAEMNISWTATFPKVNLWLVPNFDWSSSVELTSDTSATNFHWTVDCFQKCDVPWLLRAVDAEGQNGDFVSAEFWMMPASNDSMSTGNSQDSTTFIKVHSTITLHPTETLTLPTSATHASGSNAAVVSSAQHTTNSTAPKTGASTTLFTPPRVSIPTTTSSTSTNSLAGSSSPTPSHEGAGTTRGVRGGVGLLVAGMSGLLVGCFL